MSTEDITTGPGFVAKARKAFVAGVGAVAASIGPAIVVAGADGVIDFASEVVPLSVVGLTLGLGAFLAVYATPNAQ
ncbi:hypothetical protein [Microbacterium aurantiacum]|uniref:hypothetical protein n=1 Tax=Microbacterium aurantiacum TaxID=162393 RepID=UPI0034130533